MGEQLMHKPAENTAQTKPKQMKDKKNQKKQAIALVTNQSKKQNKQ